MHRRPTQSSLFGDLTRKALRSRGRLAVPNFHWFILNHWNYLTRFQQFGIAPDMLVALLLG